MKILVYVRTHDGRRFRVSLDEWQSGIDPLTVYNNRGIPVYTTHPDKRWSGIIYLERREIVGLLTECSV